MSYETLLSELSAAIGPRHVQEARVSARRLLALLPPTGDDRPIYASRVLMMHGGGKDGSYALGFIRLVHLLIRQELGDSFTLRVTAAWQPGMNQEVRDNIDAVYTALGLYDDPRVELSMVTDLEYKPFDKNAPFPSAMMRRFREDMLMAGNLTGNDPRRTNCDACNAKLVGWQVVAAVAEGGVDLIITGDSPNEQKDYGHWIAQLYSNTRSQRREGKSRAAEANGNGAESAAPALNRGRLPKEGAGRIFAAISQISNGRNRALHGDSTKVAERDYLALAQQFSERPPQFFSLYDDTRYEAGDHFAFLTDYLGYTFDTFASAFSETDCVMPHVFGYMFALQAEYLSQGRMSKQDGMREYADFGIALMKAKKFPDILIERMQNMYLQADDAALEALYRKVQDFVENHLGIPREQMVTSTFSPFAEHGKNMATWLVRARAGAAHPKEEVIRKMLAAASPPATEVEKQCALWLEGASGLDLAALRHLYTMQLVRDPFHPEEVTERKHQTGLSALYDGDPHQRIVSFVATPGVIKKGVQVKEQVARSVIQSGR